jgi:hypothetical protein
MRREYDFSKARRGPVVPAVTGKTRITIRIDDDILAWFRARVHAAGGGSYQTLMNQVLRRCMEQANEPLEETLRRVIREELPAYRVRSGGPPAAAAKPPAGPLRPQRASSTKRPPTAAAPRSRRKQ